MNKVKNRFAKSEPRKRIYEPSKTVQSAARETNINVIMKKIKRGIPTN